MKIKQSTTLGKSTLEVNRIGLGCMGMSEFYGSFSEAENLSLLDRAAELGCTFWDTADVYGPFKNEILLSKALKGRRDKITLATKFGNSRDADGKWLGIKGSADYVKTSCEASLKRLKTDYIDLYYQHRVDPGTPIEETVGAMSELVKKGKVRYIGLSEASPEIIGRAHRVHPITALQTEYSLWSREPERELFDICKELGITFVAYSPLGRGFLAGAIKSRSDLEKGDWRLRNPRFTDEAIKANLRFIKVIEEIALSKEATKAQVALAWILVQNDEITAIPGTRKIQRLEENLGALNIELSQNDLDIIKENIPEETAGERY